MGLHRRLYSQRGWSPVVCQISEYRSSQKMLDKSGLDILLLLVVGHELQCHHKGRGLGTVGTDLLRGE